MKPVEMPAFVFGKEVVFVLWSELRNTIKLQRSQL